MLIDERAISASERAALFFSAAKGTKLVGSPTAGVNGDVIRTHLPGAITVSFSGLQMRYPDGRDLFRVVSCRISPFPLPSRASAKA